MLHLIRLKIKLIIQRFRHWIIILLLRIRVKIIKILLLGSRHSDFDKKKQKAKEEKLDNYNNNHGDDAIDIVNIFKIVKNTHVNVSTIRLIQIKIKSSRITDLKNKIILPVHSNVCP